MIDVVTSCEDIGLLNSFEIITCQWLGMICDWNKYVTPINKCVICGKCNKYADTSACKTGHYSHTNIVVDLLTFSRNSCSGSAGRSQFYPIPDRVGIPYYYYYCYGYY